ncbi:WXG100 family type VII secretion target [Microbacterium rhizophilus]|uniref:WXG100 family type VII secretion target n=1 Tax=Microbacterium rhizophilus TaxID=3138934 RepID=UPI0031EAB9AE
MVQFRVRAESLTEVAAHLGSVIATFDGNLAAVESQVNGVLPTWKGDDQESFAEHWKAFTAMADAVRMSLTALQGGLMAASAGYDTTEAGVSRGFATARPTVSAVRRYSAAHGRAVGAGEARAEDMAEFFGRDYAGDREREQFGGGAVRAGAGRYSGGGTEDTDGDGDSDGIGAGPFLLQDSVDELNGVPGADGGEPGPSTEKNEAAHDGDRGDGDRRGGRDARLTFEGERG